MLYEGTTYKEKEMKFHPPERKKIDPTKPVTWKYPDKCEGHVIIKVEVRETQNFRARLKVTYIPKGKTKPDVLYFASDGSISRDKWETGRYSYQSIVQVSDANDSN